MSCFRVIVSRFGFKNGVLGHAHPSLSLNEFRNPAFLFWRTLRAVDRPGRRRTLLEGMVDAVAHSPGHSKGALGTFRPAAFWITAILFASEHGPYWDVGLLAGIVYNAWMVRSKSLADCILMIRYDAALCAFVILATPNGVLAVTLPQICSVSELRMLESTMRRQSSDQPICPAYSRCGGSLFPRVLHRAALVFDEFFHTRL